VIRSPCRAPSSIPGKPRHREPCPKSLTCLAARCTKRAHKTKSPPRVQVGLGTSNEREVSRQDVRNRGSEPAAAPERQALPARRPDLAEACRRLSRQRQGGECARASPPLGRDTPVHAARSASSLAAACPIENSILRFIEHNWELGTIGCPQPTSWAAGSRRTLAGAVRRASRVRGAARDLQIVFGFHTFDGL
jgi:hypothetical protein